MRSFKTATRIRHYIYNLIIVIKFIFPRLKLHEFECVFLYFQTQVQSLNEAACESTYKIVQYMKV
jgi:hypothetical protein